MFKLFRFLAIGTFSAALTASIAWAQTYTAVNYPGAATTSLIGGPNPQGTSVGDYSLTVGGQLHGFALTAHGVFTSFDPPGSTSTSPDFIAPQGTIVGSYVDAGGVEHGFILSGGTYTTVDYPGAAGTVLSSINPSGEISGSYCATTALCTAGLNPQFRRVQGRRLHQFRPARRSQWQRGQRRDPIGCSRRFLLDQRYRYVCYRVSRIPAIQGDVRHH